MNDKVTTTGATRPVERHRPYKISYSWVNGLGQLRLASLVFPAVTPEEAAEKAKTAIEQRGIRTYRIGKITEY